MTVGQIVMYYHYGCEIHYGKPRKIEGVPGKDLTKPEKEKLKVWKEKELAKYYTPEELAKLRESRGKK